MNFRQIRIAIYATYLTNKYGFMCKWAANDEEIRKIRDIYAHKLLGHIGVKIVVDNPEKAPKEKCVLLCNHKSVIDPLVIDISVENTPAYGMWIAKKELYNSFFFGVFVRNAGTILLDRESSETSGFFKDVKESVQMGRSIFIFPEGTRNKTDKPLTEFKDGAKIIAIKNRLPIIPVYIKTNANDALMKAIKTKGEPREVHVVFGDPIDPKDKSMSLEENYRKQFDIKG